MCLWATLYLEAWKRTEKFTACKWGMVDFEQEQMSRPEFEALAFERESAVTGKKRQGDIINSPLDTAVKRMCAAAVENCRLRAT